MSIASSWLDVVVGIDFHIEIVPTPVPTPTPIPHPHCSIIWDPVGFVVGEVTGVAFAAVVGAPVAPGGPVLVGGSMGTVVGDAAAMPVKHILIPPGTAFAVGLPPSDAELMFGSQSVTLRGSSAVRAGEVALPCSEPVPLPTGSVVAIPKGPFTTLIGGPPAASWGSALSMLGGAALRTTWGSDALHQVVKKVIPEKLPRLRRLAHKSACFFTGHPVNVATGGVTTSAVDFALRGPIPLTLTRDYDTNWFDRKGPLGHGWSHSLDGRVWIEEGRVVLLTEDGRELEFSTRDLHEGVARDGDELWHPMERATLRALGHHRWTLRTADGLLRTYGPVAGEPHDDERRGCSRLITTADRAGHEIRFAYDDRARLSEITDSAGRTVAFEHDAADRMRRVWLPAPGGDGMRQHAEFRYDDAGDLVEVKDAAGKSTRFEYDRHLLVRETDRRGLSFYFTYDGYGRYARCTRTWGDEGIYDHLIDYDRPGRKTIVTNSLGEPTVYECNALGLVVAIQRPNGSALEFEYDVAGRLLAETDELGQVTRHECDERGNRVKTTAPDGAVTSHTFDEHDQRVAMVDAAGGAWAWAYDSLGNLIARTDPLGQTTRYVYENGQLVAVSDAAGQVTRLAWDTSQCLRRVTAPDGTVVSRSYDALGRPVTLVDAGGNTQRRGYDAMGRLVRIEEPDGNVRELQRDGMGNVVRARDRLRDVTLTYFGLGKVASRTIANTTIRYHHDTEGQLVGVENEAGLVHRFEREPGGDVVEELAFDDLSTTFERDAAGRVIKVVRPSQSRWSTVQYDAAGRPIAVEHSDGGFEAYGYDALGRLTRAENQHATVALSRDALGRVVTESTTVDDETVTIESKFDHAGRRVGLRSSLGADVTIERNGHGDVLRIGQHGDGVAAWEATITRDALGHEVDRQLPGGLRSYWWRDPHGRPTQHWIGREQASARTRKLSWAPSGRLAAISDERVDDVAYDYALNGALLKATHEDGRVELRTTDDVGNLFASLSGDDRQYGRAGQIIQRTSPDGLTTYRYDDEGNLAARVDPDGGEWAYAWDAAGCLVQVDRPDGTAVAMHYDAFHRRIRRNHAGACTRWVWDGNAKLHEWGEAADVPEPRLSVEEQARVRFLEGSRMHFEALHGEGWEPHWEALLADDSAAPRAHAVVRSRHSPSEPPAVDPTVITWLLEPESFSPMARLTKATAHSIVCDRGGTPLIVADDHGETATHLSVDANGRATVRGDGTLCPFRFAGQYQDEATGLHENRFRHYDPETGRYLSRDPIGLRGGLGAYAYVADPVTQVDPLGLAPKPAAGAGCEGGEIVGVDGHTGSMPDELAVHPAIVEDDAARIRRGDALRPVDVVELPDGRQFVLDGHDRYARVPPGVAVLPGAGPVGFDDPD